MSYEIPIKDFWTTQDGSGHEITKTQHSFWSLEKRKIKHNIIKLLAL